MIARGKRWIYLLSCSRTDSLIAEVTLPLHYKTDNTYKIKWRQMHIMQ